MNPAKRLCSAFREQGKIVTITMNDLACPYCASHSVRLLDAMFTLRIMERPEGDGFVERKCSIYRCLDCGRQFDELEGGEGSESEADGGPSFD